MKEKGKEKGKEQGKRMKQKPNSNIAFYTVLNVVLNMCRMEKQKPLDIEAEN